MAKKKKNKLNKMLKAQQLQQINLGNISVASPSLALAGAISLPATPLVREISPAARHLSREIFRTLISLAVVAALLVAAVIIDRQTHYFTTFGAWLFKTLRLAGK